MPLEEDAILSHERMSTIRLNGSGSSSGKSIEEIILQVFQSRGYLIHEGTEEGSEGDNRLLLMTRGDQRGLLRFLWGSDEWGEGEVVALRRLMEELKAHRGYLVTNGRFSASARQLAQEARILLTEGDDLKDVIALVGSSGGRVVWVLPREQERPFPFARYITPFIFISLGLLILVVWLLVAYALSGVQPPTE
ncbi:MAG: restriction endonuclease [Chloroflexi bacterium]|nr:restriction endonuclease [Chloroflexota bacterium]